MEFGAAEGRPVTKSKLRRVAVPEHHHVASLRSTCSSYSSVPDLHRLQVAELRIVTDHPYWVHRHTKGCEIAGGNTEPPCPIRQVSVLDFPTCGLPRFQWRDGGQNGFAMSLRPNNVHSNPTHSVLHVYLQYSSVDCRHRQAGTCMNRMNPPTSVCVAP